MIKNTINRKLNIIFFLSICFLFIFTLFSCISTSEPRKQKTDPQLGFPQNGFPVVGEKKIVFSTVIKIDEPDLTIRLGDQVVFEGVMRFSGKYWGRVHYSVDISFLHTEGIYTCCIKDYGTWQVPVNDLCYRKFPYHSAMIGYAGMIDSFWRFQRATPEKSCLTDPFEFIAFKYVDEIGLPLYRSAKHGSEKQLVPGTSGDMRGGWHDATSTDKDTLDEAMTVVNFGLTLERLTDPLDRIPLMDEMKWGIAYLLKIQNSDGSYPFQVWWVAPWEKQKIPRHVVVNKGTGVAAGAAYALSIASMTLAAIEPETSHLCLDAAKRAWSWVIANPDNFEMENCTGYWSGGCATVLGAAVELYRVTGDPRFGEYADRTILDGIFHNGLWVKKSSLSGGSKFPGQFEPIAQVFEICQVQPLVPLARYYALTRNADVRAHLDKIFDDYITFIKKFSNNPYRVWDSGFSQYSGANYLLLSISHQLLHIAIETGKEEAAHIARDNFAWIAGCNPFGSSFIVGIGADPITKPWQRSNTDSIGGVLPGPLFINGKFTFTIVPEYNSWMVSEIGIGSSSLFSVLAIFDTLNRK